MDIAIYNYPAPGNQPIRWTAHGLKVGNPDAIAVAAIAMARWLPRGAVLVPMPSRTGSPGSTRRLAERIAEIAGATVVDALIGRRRESNYERKRAGKEPLRGAALGMRQAKPLPDGPMWIVDNVMDTGATMTAAKAALNKPSSALVYAKVVRSVEEQTASIGGCARGPAPRWVMGLAAFPLAGSIFA